MNNFIIVAVSIATFTLFTGCASTEDKSTSVEAKAALPVVNPIDEINGKRLIGRDGTVFLIRADGTIGGTLSGEEIVGVYTRSDKEMCSTYTSPKSLTDREFCSTPVIKKGSVVFNRRDGSKSQKYKIQD